VFCFGATQYALIERIQIEKESVGEQVEVYEANPAQREVAFEESSGPVGWAEKYWNWAFLKRLRLSIFGWFCIVGWYCVLRWNCKNHCLRSQRLAFRFQLQSIVFLLVFFNVFDAVNDLGIILALL